MNSKTNIGSFTNLQLIPSHNLKPDEIIQCGDKLLVGINAYRRLTEFNNDGGHFMKEDINKEQKPVIMLLDDILELLEDKVSEDILQEVESIISQVKHVVDNQHQTSEPITPKREQTVISSVGSPFLQDFKLKNPVITDMTFCPTHTKSALYGEIKFTCDKVETPN